jgi:adenosylcobinamide-phosphate synthase
MGFVSILVALLMEQARPLSRGNPVHVLARGWVRWVGHSFDAGKQQHAVLAWTIGVLMPGAAVVAVYWALLEGVGWPVAMVWNVVVLYITLGFRQFSHHFTDIRNALESGDMELSRQLLARWRQVDVAGLPRSEIVRQVVEHSVLAAHRHVFGVLAWFSILSALGLGPAGAVLYRLAEFVPRYWRVKGEVLEHPVSEPLQRLAAQCWHTIDWLPARTTAIGFAVVGSFEEAIESWRNSAQQGLTGNDGIILAATAGAINLRLGAMMENPPDQGRGESAAATSALPSAGQQPEVGHLRTVVGLVWRSVLMWMTLLALLTLARLLG